MAEEQMELDFDQSTSQRALAARKRRAARAEEHPTLFDSFLDWAPNIDVHLHSATDAVATITCTDPERVHHWLTRVVGTVRVVKKRQVAFDAATLDRLLWVLEPAKVTLDAPCLAVGRALWAHKLGYRPLRVTRVQRRLIASSPRWPTGLGVKDAPWPAIAALSAAGVPLEVGEEARDLFAKKLVSAGQSLARASLAGSSVMVTTAQPELLERAHLPGLAYAGEPDTGVYRVPLLAAAPLLEVPGIEINAELRRAIKRAAKDPEPLVTGEDFPWTLYPFQARDAARGRRILEVAGGVLLAGSMGSGKALEASTPVATPGGWVPISALTPGDLVFAPDGRPTAVTGVYPQGERPLMRVAFSDASEVLCDADHLWAVAPDAAAAAAGRTTKQTTAELATAGVLDPDGRPRWFIPITAPVDYRAQAHQSPAVAPVRQAARPGRDRHDRQDLPTCAAAPAAPLQAPVGVRTAWLREVMHGCTAAADGVLVPCADAAAAAELAELVQSLGGTATPRPHGQAPTGAGPTLAVLMPSASGLAVGSAPAPHRAITSISPAGAGQAVCISVAHPSRLFLTRSYLVTSNTTVSLAIVNEGFPVKAGQDKRPLFPLLVVCPLAAFSTWERQLSQMGKKVYVSEESPAVSWTKIEQGGWDAVVVSYDRLEAFRELLERYGFMSIIGDELQRIRTAGSRRSRSTRALAAAIPYRLGLSGTPIQNRIDDILPLGAFLSPNEWKPRATTKDLSDMYPGPDPIGGVTEHLATLMVRRRMEDTGAALPDRIQSRLFVPLLPEQEAALAALEEEAEAARKSGELAEESKMHAFVRLAKLRQIISCPELAGLACPNPKITAAIDLAKEFLLQNRKGVIFCTNRLTWQQLRAALAREGIGSTGIWGSSSLDERRKAEHDFHHDPDVRVFVGTLASCAESLTLSPTGTWGVWTDSSYSPSDLLQSEARILRLNSDPTKPVHVTHLHASRSSGAPTLDDRMLEILEVKQRLFARVIDGNSEWSDDAARLSMDDLVFLLTGKRPEDRKDEASIRKRKLRKDTEAATKRALAETKRKGASSGRAGTGMSDVELDQLESMGMSIEEYEELLAAEEG